MIQARMSLDNEEKDGSTILVKGFHHHIDSWWAEIINTELASIWGVETLMCKTYIALMIKFGVGN